MKKIVLLFLLFVVSVILIGCRDTIKVQNKMVSPDKVFEAKVYGHNIGGIIEDGKFVEVYYVHVVLKDIKDDQYNSEILLNRYSVKVSIDSISSYDLNRLKNEIIEVKAKDLLSGWVGS